MTRRMVHSVIVAGLALGLLPTTAWAVVPANGVYQGVIDGSFAPGGHNEREGYFRVRGTADAKKIVIPGTFTCGDSTCEVPAILPPTSPPCNSTNAYLEATRIHVVDGAFSYTGTADIGPSGSSVNIRFKGTWTTRTEVTGFTRIWTDSCDTGKARWTMSTPPPP